MNTILCILFVLCVAGLSLSTVISPTAQTYLRDRNPRTQVWNYVLLAFAVLLANFIRLPLTVMSPLGVWLVNLLLCVICGAFVFVIAFVAGLIYRYWRSKICI